MSLGNIIVQREAAHLITDTGWYWPDGRLAELKPKVVTLPEHRIAFTGQGSFEIVAGLWRELCVFLDRDPSARSGAIIASLAELYWSACSAQGVPSQGGPEISCPVQVCWYDLRRSRPVAFLVANETSRLPGLDPFELVTVRNCLGGDIDPAEPLGTPLDISDPAQFDVREDGARLAAEQRKRSWAIPGTPPGHYVAGDIQLTTVDAAGVRTERLIGWRDRVGDRVNPRLEPLAVDR